MHTIPLGAGSVEMKFFTTVNVTDVKIHGTATRGEKIDVESYEFEGDDGNDESSKDKVKKNCRKDGFLVTKQVLVSLRSFKPR